MEQHNRIQHYRKKMGLSQEELGEKLFVSRQTVSQWENGQTTPSIDSLVKLHEIFGVSVDELLGASTEEQASAEEEGTVAPVEEEYSFCFSKEEALEVERHQKRPFKRTLTISLIAAAGCLLALIAKLEPQILYGILLGNTGALSFYLGGILLRTRSQAERVAACRYRYLFSKDFWTVEVYKNEELFLFERKRLSEIERVLDIGKFSLIISGGRYYIVRNADLKEDSLLRAMMTKKAIAVKVQKKPREKGDISRMLSAVLIVFSILAVPIGGTAVGMVTNLDPGVVVGMKYMWLMYIAALIPLSSVLFSRYLKKKGLPHKANAIIGIIFTVILCIFGTFTFIFPETFETSFLPEEMQISLPAYESCKRYDVTEGNNFHIVGADGQVLRFSEENADAFAASMNERWLAELPDSLDKYLPYTEEMDQADRALFYNTDTGEYNTPPEENAWIVLLCFSSEENELYIFDYLWKRR